MLLSEWAAYLWPETKVEVCINFDPVFTGLAEEAVKSRFGSHEVEESYISVDGDHLVISIHNKKFKKENKK